MENTKIKVVESEQEFVGIFQLPRAIIYLSFEWSGSERFSRIIVDKCIVEIGITNIPIFFLDVSNENQNYFEKWLLNLRKLNKFNHDGNGETLLLEFGEVVDFIKYPSKLGFEYTKNKLREWLK
jgi:hypothetical protein